MTLLSSRFERGSLSGFVFWMLFAVSSGALASDECLLERWKETNPSEFERQFDRANDFDQDGERFSCNSYTTPTKILKFLENLNVAIRNEDVKSLASMMNYPLVVNLPGYKINKDGSRTGRSFSIRSKREFMSRYRRDLHTPQLVNVFKCAEFSNMMTHPYRGIALAYGEIWIYVSPDSKELRISHISANVNNLKKWLDAKNCKARD